MTAIRLKTPKTAKRGEIIEIKAMIRHKMESGYRRDERGRPIPENIIELFECIYGGETVFRADFKRGVAANPILTFYLRAAASGTLVFKWTEDTGAVYQDTADLSVTD